jgi:hypothetical protein
MSGSPSKYTPSVRTHNIPTTFAVLEIVLECFLVWCPPIASSQSPRFLKSSQIFLWNVFLNVRSAPSDDWTYIHLVVLPSVAWRVFCDSTPNYSGFATFHESRGFIPFGIFPFHAMVHTPQGSHSFGLSALLGFDHTSPHTEFGPVQSRTIRSGSHPGIPSFLRRGAHPAGFPQLGLTALQVDHTSPQTEFGPVQSRRTVLGLVEARHTYCILYCNYVNNYLYLY